MGMAGFGNESTLIVNSPERVGCSQFDTKHPTLRDSSFICLLILFVWWDSEAFPLLQESDSQSCHDDAHHGHQFDEDVERRT